mmetsp:Transcript_30719/g.49303  ORF Transcript_30719/g.49303 Transcript_30719/m.49303 type:complete len:180 (+) Transcript_30719:642-1181(+)
MFFGMSMCRETELAIVAELGPEVAPPAKQNPAGAKVLKDASASKQALSAVAGTVPEARLRRDDSVAAPKAATQAARAAAADVDTADLSVAPSLAQERRTVATPTPGSRLPLLGGAAMKASIGEENRTTAKAMHAATAGRLPCKPCRWHAILSENAPRFGQREKKDRPSRPTRGGPPTHS